MVALEADVANKHSRDETTCGESKRSCRYFHFVPSVVLVLLVRWCQAAVPSSATASRRRWIASGEVTEPLDAMKGLGGLSSRS